MNILIIGHARHGKDTVAEFLRDIYGFKFASSSYSAAKIFIYDRLKDKYGYKSLDECFEDRVNHRCEWHDLICWYNAEDKARLAKEIMKENDIYVGMRSDDEIQACVEQGVFDVVVGVYNPRKPHEGTGSFNIDLFMMSDYVILNNRTKESLYNQVSELGRVFLRQNNRQSVKNSEKTSVSS